MRAGWSTKTLDQIAENLDSKRVPITKSDRLSGEYPYYGASGIVDFVADYIFDGDALLVSEDGANLLARSTPIAFPASGKYWVNNHAHILKFASMITQRFVELYLESIPLDSYITGAAQPKLNQKALNSIPIPIPSLPEQQRIVAILDEAFDGIATAKANAERNLKNARELFESHLQSVFNQRSEGWVKNPLAELCDPIRGITYGVIKLGEEMPDGVPCLRTSNVRWLRIETDGMKRISSSLSKNYSRTILKGGEVLVNVRGTLGGVAVVSDDMMGWNVSREVAVVPIDQTKVNPFFLSYLIGSRSSQEWLGNVKKGATYVGINLEDLRLLPVRTPALGKQLEIVRQIIFFQEQTQRLEAIYQQKITALDELKKSLLHKAFSGAL